MASTRTSSVLPRLVFLVAALFCIGPARSFAADKPAGELAFTVSVPQTVTVQQAHDIAVAVSRGREWIVKQDGADQVVIYLNHRKIEATVTYVISDKDVQAYCDAYTTDGKGVRKGPTQPTRWLKYLQEDITARLAKAAGTAK